jgi:PRC-barrel domain protein
MKIPGWAIAVGLVAVGPALSMGEESSTPPSRTQGAAQPGSSNHAASTQAASAPAGGTEAASKMAVGPAIEPATKAQAQAGHGTVSAPPGRPGPQGTSAGTVLQEAEQGTSAASSAGRTIGGDAAAINYPTVDSAFASGDGIAVPDADDQSPGQERLNNGYQHTRLFTGSGEVRVKRLVGVGVFSTSDDRLGTIQDVLLNSGGEPQVILEADGRQVEVPWSKLDFALPGKELHGQVVLPGATPHLLQQLPEFRPRDQRGSG